MFMGVMVMSVKVIVMVVQGVSILTDRFRCFECWREKLMCMMVALTGTIVPKMRVNVVTLLKEIVLLERKNELG